MTESSSSEEMELSKVLKDPLALGQYLVRELDFEDRIDTLGRWTAHYLAELMHDAEHAETQEKREAAKEKALKAIFDIWDRRSALPGNAHPLKKYENVLAVLERMHPKTNPFPSYVRSSREGLDSISADLFEGFTKLITNLLFLEFDTVIAAHREDSVAINELSEDELNVLEYLIFWIDIFYSPAERDSEKNKSGEQETQAAQAQEINHAAMALDWIEALTQSLAKLKNLLSNQGEG